MKSVIPCLMCQFEERYVYLQVGVKLRNDMVTLCILKLIDDMQYVCVFSVVFLMFSSSLLSKRESFHNSV